jgi:hypothetical protein
MASSKHRLDFITAVLLTVVTSLTFAVAIATPPKAGPLCTRTSTTPMACSSRWKKPATR